VPRGVSDWGREVTNSDLIAQQAREIAALREEVEDRTKRMRSARRCIVCIGGPLNDNRLRYTPEQMFEWHRVLNYLED